MRKILISAAIIALMGGPAMAQDRDHGDRGGNPSHGGGGAPHSGPHDASNPAARGGPAVAGSREHRNAPAAAPNAMRGNAPRDNNALRGNAPRDNNAMRGNAGPRSNSNRPNFNAPNNAMRGNAGPRHDFSGFRNFHQNFNAARRFRAPAYRRPPGFYSHRWGWGEFLPRAFWARDYWLIDFGLYGLPPPPFGAIWVRVGDDALLIDQYSGEIIEVEYGIFLLKAKTRAFFPCTAKPMAGEDVC